MRQLGEIRRLLRVQRQILSFRLLPGSLYNSGRGTVTRNLPKPGAIDTLPFGFNALKRALELMSSYALKKKIILRRYSIGKRLHEIYNPWQF